MCVGNKPPVTLKLVPGNQHSYENKALLLQHLAHMPPWPHLGLSCHVQD